VYRNSYNCPEATGKKMRDALMAYAVAVRDKDWPEMARGRRGSAAAAKAYTGLSYTIGQAKSEDIALQPSILHAISACAKRTRSAANDPRAHSPDRGQGAPQAEAPVALTEAPQRPR
jgi:hypothetical protein